MKIIKIINNELIEISDYRCSASLFPEVPPTIQNNKDQIEHCNDWCVFKRTINPFQLYAENDRLNNIINELEKILTEEYDYCDKHIDPVFGTGMGVAKRTLDKLKELKENK